MFQGEAERLLRTKWKDPNTLAQEVYAILASANLPLSHDAPVTINNDGSGRPGIVLRGFDGNTPAFQIQHADGSVVLTINGDSLDLGGLPVENQGAAPPFLGSTGLGGPSSSPGGPGQNQQPQRQGGGGNAGSVLSNTGPAAVVQLVDGTTVDATIRQIDPAAVVPAGTAVLVTTVDGVNYCQPPVWL